MTLRAFAALASLFLADFAGAAIRVEQIPEQGLQAEVAAGPDGTVHLVYLRGDAKAADIRYTWRKAGGPWQPGVTVNSRSGPGVAMGSIRGPQLALGAQGAVHLVWNGASGRGNSPGPALWYAMKPGAGQTFTEPRDLLGMAFGLDGGASVAANGSGGVHVVWHGHLPPDQPEEKQRRILVRASQDEGKSFGAPVTANEGQPGVCACCSLKTSAGPGPLLNIFYRSAVTMENRTMQLLSRSGAASQTRTVDNWKTPACPMSSAALAPWQHRLLGAWETSGKIHAQWLCGQDGPVITAAPSAAKHPALAISPQGKILIAWVEGTGWNRGGTAAWQEFDLNLQPTGPGGSAPDVPVWGRAAVYAEPEGGFVLLK